MSKAEGLPIRRLMGLAFAQLGWSPAAFWAATPAELYAALEALNGEDPRRSFASFKKQFGGGRQFEENAR